MIKFHAALTYFWRANRKQHVRKSRRSKRNGSPLFIAFFYVVATCKAITSDFSSATDYSTSPKKATSCVTPCIYAPVKVNGIATSTAIGVCKDFIQALCQLKDQFIKFPTCPAQVREKIQDFREKSTFPNVVGAIDGTHIPIRAPKENHEDYFNRKHYYSFIVQGIVDASGTYLSVSTGFPGSRHDARVLRLSNFWSLAEENTILNMPCMDINGTQIRPLILGDSAYPLKSWLMRSFQDNGALTAARRHVFGQTKARWRCLHKRIDEDTIKIPYTVTACCVLRNICILMNDDFDGLVLNNHLAHYVGDDELEANDARQAIVDYFF